MDFLRVRNWDRWQSYRSDRGQPPWIKVHRTLLTNLEFAMLSDAEKGHLMAIWLLAATRNGCIPNDAKLVQRLCNLELTPDLNRFLSLQFLEKVKKRRRRNVALEREEETEEEVDPIHRGVLDVEVGSARDDCAARPTEAVSEQLWQEWLTHRRELRKPMTKTTRRNQGRLLDRVAAQGGSADAVIKASLESGWTGLFERYGFPQRGGRTNGARPFNPIADAIRRADEAAAAEEAAAGDYPAVATDGGDLWPGALAGPRADDDPGQ